jgi:hypothetical protein
LRRRPEQSAPTAAVSETRAEIHLLRGQSATQESALAEQAAVVRRLTQEIRRQEETVRRLEQQAESGLSPRRARIVAEQIMGRLERELHLSKLRMGR